MHVHFNDLALVFVSVYLCVCVFALSNYDDYSVILPFTIMMSGGKRYLHNRKLAVVIQCMVL